MSNLQELQVKRDHIQADLDAVEQDIKKIEDDPFLTWSAEFNLLREGVPVFTLQREAFEAGRDSLAKDMGDKWLCFLEPKDSITLTAESNRGRLRIGIDEGTSGGSITLEHDGAEALAMSILFRVAELRKREAG